MVVQCALVLDGPPWILILIFLHQPSCLPSTKWLSRPLFFLSDSKPPKFNLFCLAFPYSIFFLFLRSPGVMLLCKCPPLNSQNRRRWAKTTVFSVWISMSVYINFDRVLTFYTYCFLNRENRIKYTIHKMRNTLVEYVSRVSHVRI